MIARTVFEPVTICGIPLRNRVVMSPMTRSCSPDGVPGPNVAEYYRRRAAGGTGLIITEGTWIPHSSASNDANVPVLGGDEQLAGWRAVVKAVHDEGGRIFPQLWHCGLIENPQAGAGKADLQIEPHQRGPSGLAGGMMKAPKPMGEPMREQEIREVVLAFGQAARNAAECGFDGIEIHGAHGYLIDQFLWHKTNLREDGYGGDLAARTRFAVEVIGECRSQVGKDLPISVRISQWKQHQFEAKLAETPDELAKLLAPLADAGVDIFHCSTRNHDAPEFEGSALTFAGWVRKLSGKPVIAVGSIGQDPKLAPTNIDFAAGMVERGEVDLIAIGRPLIANPDWVAKMKESNTSGLRAFDRSMLATLD